MADLPPLLTTPRSGVIFDMDGLLLDSETLARRAWRHAARWGGAEMTDELFASLIGRTRDDSTLLLRIALGPNFDVDAAYLECSRHYNEIVDREGLPLKPGARELPAELAARGVPLAIATSTRRHHALERLEQAGLLKFFRAVVGGDEVQIGKPAPDIYQEAARRLDLDPGVSYALEDSHNGVRSAHAAGLRVIMVPDLLPATAEISALAWKVVPSLHEARALFIPARTP